MESRFWPTRKIGLAMGEEEDMARRRYKGLMVAAMAAACLVAPACSRPPAGAIPGPAASRGLATITVQAKVTSGAMRTQSMLAPYTKTSIQHLVIKVFALEAGQEVAQLDANGSPVQADLLGTQLENAITFTHLKFDTTYRIRCYAYRAAGTSTQDLISTTDERSYTDVQVSQDDRPAVSSLRVQLIDIVVSGETTVGGVVVSDGHIIEATSSVGIVVGPSPTPTPTPTPEPSPTFRMAAYQNLGNLDDNGKSLANFASVVMASGDVPPGPGYVLRLVVTRSLFRSSYTFRWGRFSASGYEYGPDTVLTAWSPGAYVSVKGIGGTGLLALSLATKPPSSTLYDRITVK